MRSVRILDLPVSGEVWAIASLLPWGLAPVPYPGCWTSATPEWLRGRGDSKRPEAPSVYLRGVGEKTAEFRGKELNQSSKASRPEGAARDTFFESSQKIATSLFALFRQS